MNPINIANELVAAGASVLITLPGLLLVSFALIALAASRKGGV